MTVTQRASERQVQIPAGRVTLPGELAVPEDAIGLVAFAPGSSSSRFSPRNLAVARSLRQMGIGSLLFDLLTEDESLLRANILDLPLLAERLLTATEWLALQPDAGGLRLGYFGAGTGAGATLIAAAQAGTRVCAVVSRGGRPHLAREWLPKVTAPTLLIVGGLDATVMEFNRMALAQLRCTRRLAVVPGATHLFEEPGAIERVSRLTGEWFSHHLRAPVAATG